MSTAAECYSHKWLPPQSPRGTCSNTRCFGSAVRFRSACRLLPPLGDSQRKLNSAAYITRLLGTPAAQSTTHVWARACTRDTKRRNKDKRDIIIKRAHLHIYSDLFSSHISVQKDGVFVGWCSCRCLILFCCLGWICGAFYIEGLLKIYCDPEA